MHRKVEGLFTGPVTGGWKPIKEKKAAYIHHISYHKSVVLQDGEKFCDQIEISLHFDAQSKLSGIEVLSDGGCFDKPCPDQ